MENKSNSNESSWSPSQSSVGAVGQESGVQIRTYRWSIVAAIVIASILTPIFATIFLFMVAFNDSGESMMRVVGMSLLFCSSSLPYVLAVLSGTLMVDVVMHKKHILLKVVTFLATATVGLIIFGAIYITVIQMFYPEFYQALQAYQSYER